MAQRRMFNKTIIDSDAFLEMPLSTQALYFHLCMRADDDGFVNNPRRIRSMVGCSEDDLKLLIVKRFVLAFENGVVVIKHWRIHNYIQNDRYKATAYQDEMHRLVLEENGAYTEAPCIQNVSKTYPQDRLELEIESETHHLPAGAPACETDEAAVMEDEELAAAMADAPGEDADEREKQAYAALVEHIKQKRKLRMCYKNGVMLSDYQWESLCAVLSVDELDHYTGVLIDCINKGHRPKSHYAFIMKMVEKDRQIAPEAKKEKTT